VVVVIDLPVMIVIRNENYIYYEEEREEVTVFSNIVKNSKK